MRESWMENFARILGRWVPDAFSTSVFLLAILIGIALSQGDSFAKTMDAYYRGLWMLLPFTMQMTLIITLSTVLGSTTLFARGIARLSRLPRNPAEVIACVGLLTGIAAYLYWGLGMALAPLIAVHFAKQAESRGIAADFPFLLAVGAGANALWQYGLSSSAALLVATPGHFLEKLIGVIPLSKTIWSPAALLQTFLFAILLVVFGCLMRPRTTRPISAFPESLALADEPPADPKPETFAERLEHQSIAVGLLCLMLIGWLWVHFVTKGMGLDINSLNTTLLLLCLVLQGNVHRFTKALQKAILSAWPVIVLYHLYAGVAGVIQFTSVGEFFAQAIKSVSTPLTYPSFAAASAALVSIFVPSSGGQWAIQGFVTSKVAMDIGVSVPRGLLALSVGDHVGNLASPFWYAVIGGMARVNFRDFFGYGLVYALIWFVLGVIVFTFAPC